MNKRAVIGADKKSRMTKRNQYDLDCGSLRWTFSMVFSRCIRMFLAAVLSPPQRYKPLEIMINC